MTERGVERLLRQWYRDEVGDESASDPLRDRVIAIAGGSIRLAPRTQQDRLLLIAAAVLLGTLLIATTIVAGSDLLRRPTAVIEPTATPSASVEASPPTPTPSASVEASLPAAAALSVDSEPGPGCSAASLDKGVLLALRHEGEAELLVFDDGRVVDGRPGQLEIGEEWRQRRLTEGGVARLLDAVQAAELPNCLRTNAGSPTYLVVARPGAAPLAVSAGSDRGLRPPADDEGARLAELLAKIDDLDAWLTSEDWLDTDWLPYEPRWQVWIDIDPGPYGSCPPSDISVTLCIPPGDNVLPGNTDLTTFGELHPAQPNQPYAYRCGEVTALEAEEIVRALRLVAVEPGEPKAREARVGRETHLISVRSFLPHETACEREAGFRSPEAPPDALPDLDPCAYVPRTLPQVLFHRGTRGLRTEHWAWCYLWLEHGEIDVYMRAVSTSTEEAATYVASLFGEMGVSTEATGDAVLFINACFGDTADCRPAIAISAEPYLFVIAEVSGEMLAELRPVAEAIRDNLADADDEP